MIKGHQISYSYDFDPSQSLALENIDIYIKKGEWITLLGENGSGKSSLAKHINALLSLQTGSLVVGDVQLASPKDISSVRQFCGMIFQNPDNQFVSPIVREDLCFGLQNHQIPKDEWNFRIHEALSLVEMDGYENAYIHTLSGGQKQRIALAGILALNPHILIFDEATSMLDPSGRDEVLSLISRLHKEEGKTIIMISHYVEEAIFSDKIYLMNKGQIIAAGSPLEILSDACLLKKAGLLPPLPVRLFYDLQKDGIQLGRCPITNQELIELLCQLD